MTPHSLNTVCIYFFVQFFLAQHDKDSASEDTSSPLPMSILAEGAIALSVTLSGGALFAS